MKAKFSGLRKGITAVSVLGALVFGPVAMAAKSKSGASADVLARVAAAGSDAVLIAKREVGGKHYLFVNQPSQKAVAVVDITNAKKPRIIKSVAYPEGAQSAGEILGTNLLLLKAEKPANRGEGAPVQVIAFGGPEADEASQQFTGLTSFFADEDRGLVYFTNADGLWIVRVKQTPRQDVNDNNMSMDLTGIYG